MGTQPDATLSPPGSTQWHRQADIDDGFPRINGLKMNGSHMSCENGICTVAVTPAGKSGNDREDGAMSEAVRGIYRMWKAQTPSATTDIFVEMVKLALEGL